MMMRKTYLLILFAFLLSLNGSGQDLGFYLNQVDESSNRLQGKIRGENYYITALANSNFFLQKDWLDATVQLVDDDVFEGLKVRYLVFDDELVAFNEKMRSLYIVDKDIIKQFSIKERSSGGEFINRKFVKLFFDGGNGGWRFFEELYSGSYFLLADYYIEAMKVSPFADKMGVMRDTQYRLDVNYYMYSSDKGFSKLQKRRRSFYKIFPEHKKEIRKIFRQNRILLSNEKSMEQAFSLLDKAGLLN
jgi:hypothetical protein